MASAEASLRRLRSDYIDLLQLHNPPPEALSSNELQAALVELCRSGKIRTWGVSAKSPTDAAEALSRFDAPVIQANFNMMDTRAVTSDLLAEVTRRRAGFIARTPLCFGFLSGTITRQTKFGLGDHRNGWSRAQLENWIDGADELLRAVRATPGVDGVRSALRFCLSFESVSTVIPGILTPSEAEQNARASDMGPLTPEVVAEVIAINARREFFVAPSRQSTGKGE